MTILSSEIPALLVKLGLCASTEDANRKIKEGESHVDEVEVGASPGEEYEYRFTVDSSVVRSLELARFLFQRDD